MYVCEKSKITISIAVPCPILLILPENTTTVIGEDVHFSCLAFSFGSLRYDWKRKDGNQVTMTTQRNPSQDGSYLIENMTIKNVNTTNEGWYCCVTTNECSKDRMHCAWLEVRGEHSLEQTVESYENFRVDYCPAATFRNIQIRQQKYSDTEIRSQKDWGYILSVGEVSSTY